jgi:hypothetical protein
MSQQANGINDGAPVPINATTSPSVAAPAAIFGGQRQAFVPAGVCATGIGGRRVLWPVAIGAASIVLAGQNLLTQLGGYVQFLVRFATSGKLRQLVSEVKGLDARAIFSLGMGTADWILPMLLLAAGILVWRQSRRAPGLLKAYAIIQILLIVGVSIVQAIVIPTFAGISDSSIARTYLITTSLWRATTHMIYPVFLLIWFSRPKVKAETRLWR